MERPRLRPLEGYPVRHKGEMLLALRDPSLLSDEVATLPPLAVAVVQLFDGESTRDQICEEFHRRHKQRLSRAALDGLIAQLEAAKLLDSDSFRAYSATLFGEFARAEARPPIHAGRDYPADPERLRTTLDGFFDPPRGPGRPQPGTGPLPRAIVAPHIDFQRGGPAYAWAYRPLADARELPQAIVVLGTDHGGIDHPFTLTRKHFDTPLGRVATDAALVGELVARLPAGRARDALFADEHHHRGEHSLEFQMVWLRHVLGDRLEGIPVLPILCGSLHEFVGGNADPAQAGKVGGLLRHLAAILEGKRVLWIAGADLAHLGPRFGDEQPLDETDHASLERRDREALAPALEGSAAGWFQEIRRERDRRRVCGLAPIYALLEAGRPGPGRLAVYAQCPAGEGSIVSIASIVYPPS